MEYGIRITSTCIMLHVHVLRLQVHNYTVFGNTRLYIQYTDFYQIFIIHVLLVLRVHVLRLQLHVQMY